LHPENLPYVFYTLAARFQTKNQLPRPQARWGGTEAPTPFSPLTEVKIRINMLWIAY